MLSFKNQVVLITGASRGVGAAAAIRFAEAGAAGIVINYKANREAALSVAQIVEGVGAKALVAQADISQAGETESLFRQTLDTFGQLNAVVANAGIWPAEDRAITELDETQWNETMRINVNGVYHVCREAAAIFTAQRSGNIVIVSSTAGQRGEAFHADYAASKGAVISLTKSLAVELGRFNVNVNCVAPGWIDTDMAASALRTDAAKLAAINAAIPLGRVATAEDVANPILFLASDLARHITGEILNVNGGSVLCG
ncbi:MAG TPA: SDR family NAD(P)-dependent oxidoreductase [Blastocatellia bacterium]|nr:SDR family NAD(P)-dependent oxidoreductase [Blastocatellia bacterium]